MFAQYFIVVRCFFIVAAFAMAIPSSLLARALTPPNEARLQALVAQMTLAEKISLLGGTGFATNAVPRLGIPALTMTDGPVGIRWGQATAFPSGIAMASSFDPSLLRAVAGGMARDALALGRFVVLAPCVNLTRNPFGGRNFESFGEDPFLTSRLAEEYIRGIQNEGAIATVKHFALNEQEFDRHNVDTYADERTLRELHFPAFQAAIRAGVWTIMSAYNRVNGHYASENHYLLNEVLKGEWQFRGLVVSDWGAVHSTVPSALNGLDLEMPYGEYFGEPLLQAVLAGQVPLALIDDKVTRILRVMDVAGLLDGTAAPASGITDDATNRGLALKLAQESIVLLKNDGVLPLSSDRTPRVAVIGPSAAQARSGGGGSSYVDPHYRTSPLEGLRGRSGNQFSIRYALGARLDGDVEVIDEESLFIDAVSGQHGVQAEYFANSSLSGAPTAVRRERNIHFNWNNNRPHPALPEDGFSARFRTKLLAPASGKFILTSRNDDGVRVFLDGEEIISDWVNHGALVHNVEVNLRAGYYHDLVVEYYDAEGAAVLELGMHSSDPLNAELARAVATAKDSDVVLLFVGLSHNFESEGFDRQTLELPENQRELINAILAANPNTVLVLNAGSTVLLHDWVDRAKAVVSTWYYGQEGGNAIADILLGHANPSGKLPFTWIKRWEDHSSYGNYPGSAGRVDYKEGVFLGYRWADQRSLEPQFPFGFGLSYSQFKLASPSLQANSLSTDNPSVTIEIELENISSERGAEVVQVYVQDEVSSLPRPIRELKGFKKVWLNAGESRRMQFELDRSSFAFYDSASRSWVVEPGNFRIWLGTSSRDLPIQLNLRLE